MSTIPPNEDDELDGRGLRRERNRDAIVEALLELCNEGHLDASAAQIAERAGLSARSLFRYFDDIDDLYRTVCQEQFDRVLAVSKIHNFGQGSTLEKVENLVDQRIRIYRSTVNVGRVARSQQYKVPAIAKMLAQGRDALMETAAHHFRAELDSLDRVQRVTALSCIDVFTSFEALDRLFGEGSSVSTIRNILTSTLLRTLTVDHPSNTTNSKK